MSQAGVIGLGGSTVAETLTGNNAVAVPPTGNNINVVGSGGILVTGNAGTSTLTITGPAGTITTIDGNTGNTGASATPTIAAPLRTGGSGDGSSFFTGDNVSKLTFTITSQDGFQNIFIGSRSGEHATTTFNNICLGVLSGFSLTTASGNSANILIGPGAGQLITTGSENTIITNESSGTLVTGNYNLILGTTSGQNYNGAESSNILFMNQGVVGESHVMRLGTTGSGIRQVNKAFIAGTASVVVANKNYVTIDTTTGQLGSDAGPSGGITTIDGNSGNTGATTTPTITTGAANAEGTALFTGDNLTKLTLTFTDSPTNHNTGIGYQSLSNLGGGIQYNTAFGSQAGKGITSGILNTCLGWLAGSGTITGNANLCLGQETGTVLTSGSNNCFIGDSSTVTTGSNNILIGVNAGSSYTSSEDSNISITNPGTVGESHVIRIGNQGNTAGRQNTCFIAGIAGVTVANTNMVTIDTTTGQLGSAAVPGGIGTLNGNTGSATGSTVTVATDANFGNFTFAASGASVLFQPGNAGSHNTFAGPFGGNLTLSGTDNTCLGWNNSFALTSGSGNTSIGAGSMPSNASGGNNTSIGFQALNSLGNGANNTALGYNAGVSYAGTESSNICIRNAGTVGESNVIRIGTAGSGAGQQNICFIAGITGVTTGGAAVAALVDGSGQLGTISSSIRYKKEVQDIGSASDKLHQMRPVSFRYKSGQDGRLQYGLIAEEVEQVMPELVVHDSKGKPETIQYHLMTGLLLNEIQKLRKEVNELKSRCR